MASPQSPSSSPRHYSLFLAIFSLAVGGFCIGTTEFVAMGLIQEIAHNLKITVPEAGHFISAYALGVVIGAPIIAILGAKVPRKTLLLCLMLFYGIANACTALAHTPETVLVSRFIAGLPHGAYFGVGALVAAELAGPSRRASAVAQMMMGLTVATVIGVPLATWLGQHFGWRAGFEFSATIAFFTLIAVACFVPNIPVQATASIKTELAGLKNINMWLTLAVGAIGFGGMFSVYSYVSPILTEYTKVNIQIVPIALALWGIGMVIGGALQTRLMDVAGDAQTLAASLNHSAFNLANALGAFLGGWVLSHQMGWIAPIWVGFVLSLGGLIILLIAFAVEKATQKA
ncbi:MFS transporter [Acinetobacter baumannii]